MMKILYLNGDDVKELLGDAGRTQSGRRGVHGARHEESADACKIIQDISTANHVYRQAKSKGTGTYLKLF